MKTSSWMLGIVVSLAPLAASAQQQPQPQPATVQGSAQVTIGTPGPAPAPGQPVPGQPPPPPPPPGQPVYAQPVYGQPAYGQPGSVYVQPQPVYGQPQPVYGQPQPVYGQPQPVYGQPVYGQPVYGQQPVYGRQPGYGYRPRPERSFARRLRTPGIALFAVSYGLTALTGLLLSVSSSTQTTGDLLLIPAVGPFLAAGYEATRYTSGSSYYGSTAASQASLVLVIDGLVQCGSLAMIIISLIANDTIEPAAAPRPRAAADVIPTPRHAQWSVLPFAPGAQAGMTLSVANF